MGCEVGAKPVLGWVGQSLRNGCEIFFVGSPNVFVEPGPGCVTGGADALETGFVSTLLNCSALGDGVLGAGCVGAENDFCSSVDVAVSE